MTNPVRTYFSSYTEFDPKKWSWKLRATSENNNLFMKFRARCGIKNCYGEYLENKDVLPIFNSIELDADILNLSEIEFTDTFGIIWEGKKGCYVRKGPPDYECHLYYLCRDEELEWEVSEIYNAKNNKPDNEIYVELVGNDRWPWWIDVKNISKLEFHSHTSQSSSNPAKNTYIEVYYPEDFEVTKIAASGSPCCSAILNPKEYELFIKGLKDIRPDLYSELLLELKNCFEREHSVISVEEFYNLS